jgi:hypothetical protein
MSESVSCGPVSPARPVNALDLWDAESGPGGPPPNVPVVRTDGNERLLVVFTADVVRVELHYLDGADLRGYVHCNGQGCTLCRIGRQKDQRDLLPVYSVEESAVAVLPVPPNQRPAALRPLLAPVLRRLLDGGPPVLVALRRLDMGKFSLAILPLPDTLRDVVAEAVAAFRSQLEAGAVDLAGAFQRLSNAELAAVPQVALVLRARGIEP